MSTLKVNTIKDNGTAIDLESGIKIAGVSPIQGYTASGTEPSSGNANGDYWYDSTNSKFYQYWDGEFREITVVMPANDSHIGDRGIWGGGSLINSPYYADAIFYVDITSTSNSSSFGTLRARVSSVSGTQGEGRGLFLGGNEQGSITNKIDYISTATTGNAQSQGTLVSTYYNMATASNGTTALMSGGSMVGGTVTQLTIATGTGTSSFGSLSDSRNNLCAASDGTTGFFIGGYVNSAASNTIDSVTIDTAGNATDWGDLTVSANGMSGNGACANTSRVIQGGGYVSGSPNNYIAYFDTSSAGNAIDFGDNTESQAWNAWVANETRAVVAGGYTGSTRSANIKYITIDTPGNASTFGSIGYGNDSQGGLSGPAS
jgi:hypothetical protein